MEMIACVAIVGPKNNPLHIQPIQDVGPSVLKFDYIIYVSLDAIDSILAEQSERRKTRQAGAVADTDADVDKPFLGLVSVTPEYHVYAHVTANLAKVIVLVSPELAAGIPRLRVDADVAALCSAVEAEFKRAASNPFHTPGSALDSARFQASVQAMVQQRFRPLPPGQGVLASSAVP